MKRLRRLLWCCSMTIILEGAVGYFGSQAFANSAEDWMAKGRTAYKEGKYEDAEQCYLKALEKDPKLVVKQEEWVRDRVRSGSGSKAPADLLERIGVKPPPALGELMLTHDKELMIRSSFLKKLITDASSDVKAPVKEIYIKHALIIEDLDLANVEVSPLLSISNCIFVGEVRLYGSRFERALALEGSEFLNRVNANRLKVNQDASVTGAVFRGPVSFNGANIGRDFRAYGARFDSKDETMFDSLVVGQYAFFQGAIFLGPVTFNGGNIGWDFRANGARFWDKARFNTLRTGRDAFFNKEGLYDAAVFHGPVDFAGAHTGGISGQMALVSRVEQHSIP